MKVFVYRNLHKKGNVYSIRAMDGILKGRVFGHAHGIYLENCEFHVSQAGRQRVLKEKRKNVHAGIVGDLVTVSGYESRIHNSKKTDDIKKINDEAWLKEFQAGTTVTYNPFLFTSFVIKGANIPVHKAKKVTLFHSRVEITEK